MRFKLFMKKSKDIQTLLSTEGVINLLTEKEETFDNKIENINSNYFLPIVNTGYELSLLVFGNENIYKIFYDEKPVLNWTTPIKQAINAKTNNINPIKIDEDNIFDIFIFPIVGNKKYKIQKSLFYKKSFVDTYNEMLDNMK